jgi:hypothetical protein
MYGMIHKAARELTISKIGEAAWAKLAADCEVGSEHFISGQHYSDDITFRLIGAIAEKLNVTVDELLVSFGRYWIKFAAQGAYAPALDMAGDDLETFLMNLDRMHSSIKATMPEAVLPSFSVSSSGEDSIDVAYRSPRKGLEPFVTGLLEGLLDRFGETGTITRKPSGAEVIFHINRVRASRVA